MKFRKAFLILSAIGLIPIALSYGLLPEKSMNLLFQMEDLELSQLHILRAVMGLYLGFAFFWIVGALKQQHQKAALYSLVIFMLGLAFGRIISVIIDGIPNFILLVYLGLELVFGTIGILLLKKSNY